MRSSFRPAGLLIAVACIALGACSTAASDDAANDQGEMVHASSTPKLCAAVRGNGESILTHFASLSRIVEHYGVVDGMAGGSSGSITTFTYESMLKHPAVHRCGASRCDADSEAARVALALKSVQGYADVVGDSDEAVSIKGLASTIGKIKADYAAKGIDALGTADSIEAAKRIKEVLSVPEVRALVNPEVFTMLADVAHLSFNVGEIKTSILQLGAFSVDDIRLFFRAGVLNWPELASGIGIRRGASSTSTSWWMSGAAASSASRSTPRNAWSRHRRSYARRARPRTSTRRASYFTPTTADR